ncbi:MAG: glycosyltransferase [Candidatus Absconditabacteria bacterium]|nr:glycosyltransferase [Candidatus Absconditabacteria bacterium]MDD3868551.1 glycosyltransferase [Candidatus Absconditabacteria bacterium]MDD4714115.1 glycosyltransferase [Candidatus Absconditabacteria bacterium]
MKKVAILYLNTGGGHIGYARALEKGIKRKNSDVDVVLINPLEDRLVLKTIIEDGFSVTTKNDYTGYVFDELAKIWDYKLPRKISDTVFTLTLYTYFQSLFKKQKFDYVISTHFFLSGPAWSLLKKSPYSTFFHLVADPLSPHEIWFDIKDCHYIVESEKVKNMALKYAIPKSLIKVIPMILDEKFTTTLSLPEQESFKRSLNLSVKEQVVLLIGGGEGIPNGKNIVKQLLAYPFLSKQLRFFVVCGKNEELYASLTELLEGHSKAKQFEIIGFSKQVYELMNIADVVLCKAGPATVFEVISQGKPMIIYKKFGPQEEGNVDFVLEHGCGIYESNSAFLPGLIDGLLLSDAARKSMQENIKKLDYHNGLDGCVDYIFSH